MESGFIPMNVDYEMEQSKKLEGQVALVTGGGGAIGGASAKILASSGAKVLVADERANMAKKWRDGEFLSQSGFVQFAWCIVLPSRNSLLRLSIQEHVLSCQEQFH